MIHASHVITHIIGGGANRLHRLIQRCHAAIDLIDTGQHWFQCHHRIIHGVHGNGHGAHISRHLSEIRCHTLHVAGHDSHIRIDADSHKVNIFRKIEDQVETIGGQDDKCKQRWIDNQFPAMYLLMHLLIEFFEVLFVTMNLLVEFFYFCFCTHATEPFSIIEYSNILLRAVGFVNAAEDSDFGKLLTNQMRIEFCRQRIEFPHPRIAWIEFHRSESLAE